MSLDSAITFTDLLEKFRSIERVVRVRGKEEWENDVEHSYELAMLGWYLVDNLALSLNKDRVLQYALVHDLPEVYAGDSYAYGDRKDKDAREVDAVLRLSTELGPENSIITTLRSYRAQLDEESKFVYALDKLIPMINTYLDDGRTWKEKGISLQMIIDYKQDKVAVSPVVAKLFHELVALLRKEEHTLFPKLD